MDIDPPRMGAVNTNKVVKNTVRPHRKTRTGCRRCKQRKIKCDEQKPHCLNCIRHDVQCDFTPKSPIATAAVGYESPTLHSTSASPLNTPSLSKSSTVPSITTPTSNEYTPAPCPVEESQFPLVDWTHLELLHNFTTSTCLTLSADTTIKTLWRINIPQLGMKYPFVMRSIFALSSLHLAHFRPDRFDYYVSQAMSLHQLASKEASGLLLNMNDDNAAALYIFSVLTCIFALASPRRGDEFLLVEETGTGIADWLYLIRGTQSIIRRSSDSLIHAGPLAPIFVVGARRNKLREASTYDDENLSNLRNSVQCVGLDSRDVGIYLHSIGELQRSYGVVYGGAGQDTSDVFIWLYQLEEDYLLLLRQRSQEALAIFAFACVLLDQVDHYWWVKGWSKHLMGKIYGLLDQEHRLWIQWPMEEIGWIPDLL